jgi:hypothetical protein
VFLTLKSILNNEAKGKVRNCNTLVCGFTIGSAGNHEWLVEENLNQLLMGEDLRVRTLGLLRWLVKASLPSHRALLQIMTLNKQLLKLLETKNC